MSLENRFRLTHGLSRLPVPSDPKQPETAVLTEAPPKTIYSRRFTLQISDTGTYMFSVQSIYDPTTHPCAYPTQLTWPHPPAQSSLF